MTTTGAPSVSESTSDNNSQIEYNIILYKICDQIIILQYIYSIILISFMLYLFYVILEKTK